jgi:hypothetical protein
LLMDAVDFTARFGEEVVVFVFWLLVVESDLGGPADAD